MRARRPRSRAATWSSPTAGHEGGLFAPDEPLRWAEGRLQLAAFDYVDDAGALHLGAEPAKTPALRYGCGIYTLRKTAAR